MKSLVNVLFSFHGLIEKNKTALKLIEQIDKAGGAKLAIGVGINNSYYTYYIDILKTDGYLVEQTVMNFEPWPSINLECDIVHISKDGVSYGYLLSNNLTGIVAIRWLGIEKNHLFPSNFFNTQTAMGPSEEIGKALNLTEGLTGYSFGSLKEQLETFLSGLYKWIFLTTLDKSEKHSIDPKTFDLLENTQFHLEDNSYHLYSVRKSVRALAEKQGEQIRTVRDIHYFEGLIFSGTDYKLEGFISYTKTNKEKADIQLWFINDETLKLFKKLILKNELL